MTAESMWRAIKVYPKIICSCIVYFMVEYQAMMDQCYGNKVSKKENKRSGPFGPLVCCGIPLQSPQERGSKYPSCDCMDLLQQNSNIR